MEDFKELNIDLNRIEQTVWVEKKFSGELKLRL